MITSFDTLGMYFMGMDIKYIILTAVFALISKAVGGMLQSRFRKFSKISIPYTGAQIAEMMLRDAGIHDVKIISTPGQLTDHYNPQNKTVNLSQVVYGMNNVSAAAVAAHEVGHAVQHARAYSWLQMRSSLVPLLGFGSNFSPYIIMIGLGLMAASGSSGLGNTITMIGITLFALTTLFAFVTLPVEFDASSRALRWIQTSGVMGTLDRSKAKSALDAAAMTYVVGALTSLGQLIYFISLFLGRQSDDD